MTIRTTNTSNRIPSVFFSTNPAIGATRSVNHVIHPKTKQLIRLSDKCITGYASIWYMNEEEKGTINHYWKLDGNVSYHFSAAPFVSTFPNWIKTGILRRFLDDLALDIFYEPLIEVEQY